ncbi:MAG TPA: class I SAM-dependent methyltransferase [archaeon]|jgi:SAM-dependent methyltransferase|nr:class I SAM-dependent methyltransferase [archaeon]
MQSVKEFYNKYQYPKANQYTSNQKRTNKKIILGILETAGLKEKDLKDKRILDAGCGTGEKSIFFAKAGAKEVVAIDFSKGQLEESRKKANKDKVKNLVFKEKDILKYPLEELGKFDIIVCLGVLHHTENPKKSFSRIVGQLKRKGIIIIGLYHKYSRTKYRLQRFFLRNLVSKDPDKIIAFVYKINKNQKAPKSTLYDRYAVPHESYHTLREVKGWFKENHISLIGHRNIRNEKLEITNIFEKKTIFFVSGKKKDI